MKAKTARSPMTIRKVTTTLYYVRCGYCGEVGPRAGCGFWEVAERAANNHERTCPGVARAAAT